MKKNTVIQNILDKNVEKSSISPRCNFIFWHDLKLPKNMLEKRQASTKEKQ